MWIELSNFWLIVLNISAWFSFHMCISLLMLRVPDAWLDQQQGCFLPRRWERNGEIWQEVFHVRQWKQYLPDGSFFIKSSYDQTHLKSTENKNLKQFIIETKRAELTHWLMIPPAFLFFLWNPPWAGLVMIVYALVLNIPLIITQRFNRPRLIRLYRLKMKN